MCRPPTFSPCTRPASPAAGTTPPARSPPPLNVNPALSRFNYGLRLFGTASFTLLHIGRMAVVLYLPSLALSTVSDLDLITSITVMGIISILHAVLGGIQAVIWADVVRAVVLLGGALVSFVIIVGGIDGGLGSCFTVAAAHDKFHLANLTWDVTTSSLWIVLLGSVFNHLIPLTSDQAYVQRYMTTATEKQAAKAIWVNSLMAMPSTFLFLALGTAMYVFYRQHPERIGALPSPDAIFPWFISRELPAGVGGLVVAGIFAAAPSTIATSMNSIATVITVDVVHRLRGRRSEADDLRLARWLTVLLGLMGMAAAYLLAVWKLDSMFDPFLKLMGLTGSALAGLVILGIFTRSTTAAGAAAGAAAGVLVLYWVQSHTRAIFFVYAPVGTLTCVIIGFAASRLLGRPPPALAGLTYYTLQPPADRK